MKLFAAFTSILLTSFCFSQSNDFIPYQIDANTTVKTIKVLGHIDSDDQLSSLGNILSIYDSEINLELSADINYTVIINNEITMEITGSEIAEYQNAQENDFAGRDMLGMRFSYSEAMVQERNQADDFAIASK